MSSLLQSARVSTRLLQLTRRANHVLRKSPLPNRTDVPREEQRSAGAAPNAHSSSARADPGEAQAASLCLPPLPSSRGDVRRYKHVDEKSEPGGGEALIPPRSEILNKHTR